MKQYVYKLIVSQENSESVVLEFNYLCDAMKFAEMFLECSPDDVEKPAFTIVRREKDKC